MTALPANNSLLQALGTGTAAPTGALQQLAVGERVDVKAAATTRTSRTEETWGCIWLHKP